MLAWLMNLGFAGGGASISSLPIFPSLPGQTFPVARTMLHVTDLTKTISGKTIRGMVMRWPRVQWQLQFALLRDDATVPLSELKILAGFFNQMQGKANSFLYTDSLFNTVSHMQFAVGDGVTQQFQLTATYQANSSSAGTPEIIQNINRTSGAPTLFDNGSPISASAYAIDSNGFVTFSTAPAATHVLTWSGSFYYQCSFDDDSVDFGEIGINWWELQKLSFTSVVR